MTKKEKFIQVFNGDVDAACAVAKMSKQWAMRLLEKPEVKRAIKDRLNALQADQEFFKSFPTETVCDPIKVGKIADVTERKAFLSNVMRNPLNQMSDRLKACITLGQMEGDFVIQHKGEFEVEHRSAELNMEVSRKLETLFNRGKQN